MKKRVSFFADGSSILNLPRRAYFHLMLIPTLEFIIDRQCEQVLTTEYGDIFGGEVEYCICISWLWFFIECGILVKEHRI